MAVYPNTRLDVTERGVTLFPSKAPVAPKLIAISGGKELPVNIAPRCGAPRKGAHFEIEILDPGRRSLRPEPTPPFPPIAWALSPDGSTHLADTLSGTTPSTPSRVSPQAPAPSCMATNREDGAANRGAASRPTSCQAGSSPAPTSAKLRAGWRTLSTLPSRVDGNVAALPSEVERSISRRRDRLHTPTPTSS